MVIMRYAREKTASRSAAARAMFVVCAATLALAACKTTEDPTRVAGWTLVDGAQRHPILVSQEPATYLVHVRSGASGLSKTQRTELYGFADHFRLTDAGNSRLVIEAPSGGGNEVAAMYAVSEIRDLLSDQGFAKASISVEAYDAVGDREPPIRVSYLRYVAQAPDCGDWSTNLAYEPTNLPYPNYACANQRNFAAQVANPADLLGPRSETARSSERRDQVWGKYVAGQPTGASKSRDERVNTDTSN